MRTTFWSRFVLGALLSVGLTFGSVDHAAAIEPAEVGSVLSKAPHRRVLLTKLDELDEDRLLLPGGKASLVAVMPSAAGHRADKEVVILVHGLGGKPAELQSLATRLAAADKYQIYVLAYNDLFRRTHLNGEDFADVLEQLVDGVPMAAPARRITILAHSMGGIVSRIAMNRILERGNDRRFDRIRLVVIDTPWHGYAGPSDHGAGGVLMNMSRPFIPDGLEDMRAQSDMFKKSTGATDRLSHAMLPDHFEVQLLFGKERGAVLRVGEGSLSQLGRKLVDYYCREIPVRGDAQLQNYWQALVSSSQYFAFQEEMRLAADLGRLTVPHAEALLEKHYPSFGGGHMSMLEADGPGRPVVAYLADALLRSAPTPPSQVMVLAKR